MSGETESPALSVAVAVALSGCKCSGMKVQTIFWICLRSIGILTMAGSMLSFKKYT